MLLISLTDSMNFRNGGIVDCFFGHDLFFFSYKAENKD